MLFFQQADQNHFATFLHNKDCKMLIILFSFAIFDQHLCIILLCVRQVKLIFAVYNFPFKLQIFAKCSNVILYCKSLLQSNDYLFNSQSLQLIKIVYLFILNLFMGGASTIVENSIKENSESIWNSNILSKIPSINIQTSSYNKAFVNTVALIGLLATAHLIKKGVSSVVSHAHFEKRKPPSTKSLKSLYGKDSWALVCVNNHNQHYCEYLAQNQFPILLVGSQQCIENAKKNIKRINQAVQTKEFVVNWPDKIYDQATYDSIAQLAKNLGVSILILPRIQFSAEQLQSKKSGQIKIPQIEVFFALTRAMLENLIFRQYYSAIVIPSRPQNQWKTIEQGKGIINGVTSAIDSFGRTLNFELSDKKHGVYVIVDRINDPDKAFAKMGVVPVSQ